MSNYPAAHSMDTEWFAVDRDGHLAIFSSGEDGAVPENASTDGWDIVRDVFLQMPAILNAAPDAPRHFTWPIVMEDPYVGQRSGCLYALFGIGRRPTPPPRAERLVPVPAGTVFFVAMLVNSVDALAGIHPDDRPYVGAPINGPEGLLYPVWFTGMYRESYQHLHEAGVCHRCTCCDEDNVNGLGFFKYNNDEYDLSPYVRVAEPATPLRASDLPEQLKEAVSKVRLSSVSFTEASHVQPIEHVKCAIWAEGAEGITYLSEDMQTRKPFVRTEQDKEREDHDDE